MNYLFALMVVAMIAAFVNLIFLLKSNEKKTYNIIFFNNLVLTVLAIVISITEGVYVDKYNLSGNIYTTIISIIIILILITCILIHNKRV